MRIRACTTDDFEAVFSLLRQLWPQKDLHKRRLRTVYLQRLRSPQHRHLVATVAGRVVGFSSMTLDESLWVEGCLVYVDELVVDESFRGRGIGSRLLEATIALARGCGARRVELDSAAHRVEAHGFYRQRGFENRGFVFSKPLG